MPINIKRPGCFGGIISYSAIYAIFSENIKYSNLILIHRPTNKQTFSWWKLLFED